MTEREHALYESVDRTETRLRELVSGLRELADRLDGIVSADTLSDWRSDGTLFPHPPVDPWRGVPVDARLQQFMRNALDDLTRPAAPLGLTARVRDGELRVTVARRRDPRVLGFVAFAHVDGHWRRLCRGVSTCSRRLPSGRAATAVAAFVVDVWHRRSAPSIVAVSR